MKNTTPAESDPLLSALVWTGMAIEALALLLRPMLAHAITAALLLAGWRPTPSQMPAASKSETAKPKPTTRQAKPKAAAKRRTRRPVPVAA